MLSSKQSVRFDIKSELTDRKVVLRLCRIKREAPDKGLVVCLPGMRAMGEWGYSSALRGAFQYLGEVEKLPSKEFELLGLDRYLESGLPLTLTTFGPLGGASIASIVDGVEIEIRGYLPDTCELVSEIHRVQFRTDDDSNSRNESLNRQREVEPSSSIRIQDVAKRIPGVPELYRQIKQGF